MILTREIVCFMINEAILVPRINKVKKELKFYLIIIFLRN